jgi:hypothetical protein
MITPPCRHFYNSFLSQSLKDDIRRVCGSLDERVLLPAHASKLRIASLGDSIQVPALVAFVREMRKIIVQSSG